MYAVSQSAANSKQWLPEEPKLTQLHFYITSLYTRALSLLSATGLIHVIYRPLHRIQPTTL